MAVQTAPLQVIRIKTDYLRLKRALDITFTLLISPFVLLVGILIAICIKLDSKGDVFFKQKRVGQHGEEFVMYKFRSMYTDNDQGLHQKRVAAMMINGEALTKDENDPRITKIGRFIRKTSLDELPQFWNVLKGNMTLVGPRPPLPFEVELYGERDWLRLSGRPGLTGTWQVYGRSSVTFENMVDMDIEYLSNQSLWKDIKLIFNTVPVMIWGRGAA